MTYLQLHDGPTYYPEYTGKLQPLNKSLDPFAPGAPVYSPPPFRTLLYGDGCAAQLPQAIQKGSAQSWQNAIKNLLALYNSISSKGGMGQAFVPGSLAVIAKAIQYLPQIVVAGYAAIQGFAANQINALAQQWFDTNKYNMQNLCTMSNSQLEANMLQLDRDIARAAENVQSKPIGAKAPYKRELAVLSELRIIYENQLAINVGQKAPGKGLLPLGLIATALTFLR